MLNYGADCAAVDPDAWSEGQVYLVSWGLADQYVMPEIYYDNSTTPSANPTNAAEWQSIYDYSQGAIIFTGTTSQNGFEGSMNWATAWKELNDLITNDPNFGSPNNVKSSATNI